MAGLYHQPTAVITTTAAEGPFVTLNVSIMFFHLHETTDLTHMSVVLLLWAILDFFIFLSI